MVEVEYTFILKELIGDTYWFRIFIREHDEEFGKEVGYAMINLQTGDAKVVTILKPNAVDSRRLYKEAVREAEEVKPIIGKKN